MQVGDKVTLEHLGADGAVESTEVATAGTYAGALSITFSKPVALLPGHTIRVTEGDLTTTPDPEE